jgi:hypothetical protein
MLIHHDSRDRRALSSAWRHVGASWAVVRCALAILTRRSKTACELKSAPTASGWKGLHAFLLAVARPGVGRAPAGEHLYIKRAKVRWTRHMSALGAPCDASCLTSLALPSHAFSADHSSWCSIKRPPNRRENPFCTYRRCAPGMGSCAPFLLIRGSSGHAIPNRPGRHCLS